MGYCNRNRGHAYAELGQYQRAIEDYNEANRLIPDYAEAYYNRANAYIKLDQKQRAIEDYSEAIRLKPDYTEANMNRGITYLIQGNKEFGCSKGMRIGELQTVRNGQR